MRFFSVVCSMSQDGVVSRCIFCVKNIKIIVLKMFVVRNGAIVSLIVLHSLSSLWVGFRTVLNAIYGLRID